MIAGDDHDVQAPPAQLTDDVVHLRSHVWLPLGNPDQLAVPGHHDQRVAVEDNGINVLQQLE